MTDQTDEQRARVFVEQFVTPGRGGRTLHIDPQVLRQMTERLIQSIRAEQSAELERAMRVVNAAIACLEEWPRLGQHDDAGILLQRLEASLFATGFVDEKGERR